MSLARINFIAAGVTLPLSVAFAAGAQATGDSIYCWGMAFVTGGASIIAFCQGMSNAENGR